MRMRTCQSCGRAVELRSGRMVPHTCAGAAAPASVPRRPGTRRGQLKLRDEVLAAASGVCFYCGGTADRADHVLPWVDGGADDLVNLVAACKRCNRVKGDEHLHPRPTLALAGEIGAGKTTLAVALARHTGWPILAIDDVRRRGETWDHLVAELRDEGPAIVESVAIPRSYRLALIVRCALIVNVTCPEDVRQARLRPGAPRDRFLSRGEDAHRVVDTTEPASGSLLDALQQAAEARARGPLSATGATARVAQAGALRLT